MVQIELKTRLNCLLIKGDEKGVSEILFTDGLEKNLTEKNDIPAELVKAKQQLQEYFSGNRQTFDFALSPEGTDFQQKVWNELKNIPFGKTISYLTLAKRLGDPKVIRAAASANGKNPLPIVIPCHRVIGSDGSLTGYAGGLWRKQWLLEHEGVITKQHSLF